MTAPRPAYVEAATPEEGAALLRAGQKRAKYGAVPTVLNGERFASRGEARYTLVLEAMARAGKIAGWRRAQSYVLMPAIGTRADGFARGAVRYTPDYEVWPSPDGAPLCCVDFKSKATMTTAFRIRAAVFLRVYPDIPLYAVGADGEWVRA